MDTFGKRLKEALVAAGMTQAKLAEEVGRTKGAVTQWVHDDTEPDIRTLMRICDMLHVSADYLVRGVDTRYLDEQTVRIADRVQQLSAEQRRGLAGLIFGPDANKAS